MASASEDNRFAPPLAHVEDVVESGTGALAGRGVRLVAALLDALFAGIAFWILSFVTPLNWTPPAGANIVRALIINAVVGFMIFLVLHGYLLATRGQTIAKALLKVRIVRSDGSPASFARIVGLRYLPTTVMTFVPIVGAFYALVDCLLIFRESRRCLHDNIADTIVVKA